MCLRLVWQHCCPTTRNAHHVIMIAVLCMKVSETHHACTHFWKGHVHQTSNVKQAVVANSHMNTSTLSMQHTRAFAVLPSPKLLDDCFERFARLAAGSCLAALPSAALPALALERPPLASLERVRFLSGSGCLVDAPADWDLLRPEFLDLCTAAVWCPDFGGCSCSLLFLLGDLLPDALPARAMWTAPRCADGWLTPMM